MRNRLFNEHPIGRLKLVCFILLITEIEKGSGKFIQSESPKTIHRKQLIKREIYQRKVHRTEVSLK